MLTAAGSLWESVAGFELGADDYLPKPFELPNSCRPYRSVTAVACTSVNKPRATPPTIAAATNAAAVFTPSNSIVTARASRIANVRVRTLMCRTPPSTGIRTSRTMPSGRV